jgi:NAD(P)-dependent dehydrogenase (short-subunit alcohol dehydrogenase family)
LVPSLAFVNGAAEKFGRLDILINNAGIRKYEKVEEASGELERDPQRQPAELRLLCQGGGSADVPQQGRRHR